MEKLEWLQTVAHEIPIRIEGNASGFTIWIGRVETVSGATLVEAIERAMKVIYV